MQVSAEVRWFQLGPVPEDLRTWFCQPALDFRHRIGGGRPRKDVYLLIPETELGIKSRGGAKKGLEVKGLVDVLSSPLHFGQVSVVPQLFCKWSSEALAFAKVPTVETVKTRWVRRFDTAGAHPREIELGAGELGEDPVVESERPAVGCNVELTSVTRGDETWWTFGAESFAFGQPGRTLELVGEGLARTMQALSSGAQVDLRGARYLGYAEWIAMRR
jgi:hypothetical protein